MKVPRRATRKPVIWALARTSSVMAQVTRDRIDAGIKPKPSALVFRSGLLKFATVEFPERAPVTFALDRRGDR